MDKDSTGATGPESGNKVGSGAPSTPGASGSASGGGGVRSGVTHTDTATGQGGGQMTEEAVGGERAQQQMVDAQALVLLIRARLVIPERVAMRLVMAGAKGVH